MSGAANQLNNVELIKYKKYGDELVLLEFMNQSPSGNGSAAKVERSAKPTEPTAPKSKPRERSGRQGSTKSKSHTELLEEMGSEQARRYRKLEDFMHSLGSDIVSVKQKRTGNFSRTKKKFASLQLMNRQEQIYVGLALDPKRDVDRLEQGFTRDMTDVGSWGIGKLRVIVESDHDIERAKPLIQKAYDKAYRS